MTIINRKNTLMAKAARLVLASHLDGIEARYANFVVYMYRHTDLHLQSKNSGDILVGIVGYCGGIPPHYVIYKILVKIINRYHRRRDNRAAQPPASVFSEFFIYATNHTCTYRGAQQNV
uniref:Uncharacterized protein n=1 Tax=Glossina austeni TaxID=7395 RepID=A0A1A9VD64_GLOAU